MKRATRIAIGIGSALSFGLGAALVNAQPYGYGPGYGMGQAPASGLATGYGPGQGRGMGPQAYGNPSAMADARLAYLKSELGINAGQEAAWNAFAAQAKQQAEAMQAWRTTMRGSTTATAPERLELRNQIMKRRLEEAEKTSGAFTVLYSALTAEQKAIADQRFAGGPGHGRGFHRGPGGRFL